MTEVDESAPTSAPRPAPHPGRAVVLLFVVLVAVVAVTLRAGAEQGRDLSNDPFSYPTSSWQQPYVRWDAEWYLSIAADGYQLDEELPSSAAFFPGYPIPVRWLGAVLGDDVTAGLLLSLGAGLAALLGLGAWVRAVGKPELARTATLVLALSPFAVYLYGPLYADGLLVAATVGACWALERDRRVLLVLLGGLAAVSRVVGAVVPLALVYLLWERRRAGRAGPHPSLALLCYLPVAAHLAYLWDRFGDPLAFQEAAGAIGWNEGTSVDSILKIQFWEVLTTPGEYDAVYRGLQVLSLAITVAVLLLLPRTARVLSPGYALLAGALIGLPLLSNDDFLGFGRYALAAFPVTVAAADLLREHPRRARLLAAGSGASLVIVTFLLGMDYLVA